MKDERAIASAPGGGRRPGRIEEGAHLVLGGEVLGGELAADWPSWSMGVGGPKA
jgi:hypothetical protein